MREMDKLQSSEKVYKPCEYSTETKDHFKSNVAQFYVTFVECLFLVLIGMQYVLPTIVVGALHNKLNETMALNDDSASWIGSVLYICEPLGAVATGFMTEKVGTKGTMMFMNIPFFICWILLYYASTVQALFIAILMIGIGIGFCEAPVANYIGEISDPKMRGVFTSMTTAACNLGFMIELFVGSILDWRTSALVSAVIPVTSFIMFLTIPESPVWFITKGKMEEAHKSFAWIKGFLEPHAVQKEFDELVRYTKMSYDLSENINGNSEEKVPLDGKKIQVEQVPTTWLKQRYYELSNRKLLRPLKLVFIMFIFAQCASLAPFKAYFVEILNNFHFPVESKWVLVMTGVVSFFGSCVPIFVVHLIGKRKLTLVCFTISTITVFILGIFATFFKHNENPALSWIVYITVAVNSFVGNLGVGNMPWMLLCEIFPVRARGIASGISAAWCYILTFVLTRTFLQTENLIGLSGMFYLYGTISVMGTIYIYFSMPETEGKTLERIESYFTSNHDVKEKYSLRRRRNQPGV